MPILRDGGGTIKKSNLVGKLAPRLTSSSLPVRNVPRPSPAPAARVNPPSAPAAPQSPISFGFAEDLSSLQQRLQQSLMDLDYEEQASRRAYDDSINASALNRVQDLRRNTANINDRGLNRSGIALQSDADMNQAYDIKNSGFAQNLSSALAAVARKRLQQQNDYDMGRAALMRKTTAGSLGL